MITDNEILEAALAAYELILEKTQNKINEIREQVGGNRSKLRRTTVGKGNKRRILSQDARRRIALAQKKRWAKYHKTHGSK